MTTTLSVKKWSKITQINEPDTQLLLQVLLKNKHWDFISVENTLS